MPVNPIADAFKKRGLPVASVSFASVAMRPMEGAETVLITALPYYFPPAKGQNLARFAALPDYHRYFGGILEETAEELRALFPKSFFKPFTDNSPIDERKAAIESGLAAVGKNNLCITAKGSFVFLGELITDLPLSIPPTEEPIPCNGCGNCVKACPNGALTEDGFHYEKCLAFLTQKKGELTEEEREAIRNNKIAWGCDRCSEACPRNEGLPVAPIALPPNELLPRLTAAEIEPLSDRQFREIYAHRAFAWRGKATMLRNLTILEETNDE